MHLGTQKLVLSWASWSEHLQSCLNPHPAVGAIESSGKGWRSRQHPLSTQGSTRLGRDTVQGHWSPVLVGLSDHRHRCFTEEWLRMKAPGNTACLWNGLSNAQRTLFLVNGIYLVILQGVGGQCIFSKGSQPVFQALWAAQSL